MDPFKEEIENAHRIAIMYHRSSNFRRAFDNADETTNGRATKGLKQVIF
jgi:hypothetical protein